MDAREHHALVARRVEIASTRSATSALRERDSVADAAIPRCLR